MDFIKQNYRSKNSTASQLKTASTANRNSSDAEGDGINNILFSTVHNTNIIKTHNYKK